MSRTLVADLSSVPRCLSRTDVRLRHTGPSMTTSNEVPKLLDELLRAGAPSGYEGPAAEVWRKAAAVRRALLRRDRLDDRPGRRGRAAGRDRRPHRRDRPDHHPRRREGLPLVRADRRLGPADPGRPAGRGDRARRDRPRRRRPQADPPARDRPAQKGRRTEIDAHRHRRRRPRGGRDDGPRRRPDRDPHRTDAGAGLAPRLQVDGQPARRLRRARIDPPLRRGRRPGRLDGGRRRGAGGDRPVRRPHLGLRAAPRHRRRRRRHPRDRRARGRREGARRRTRSAPAR